MFNFLKTNRRLNTQFYNFSKQYSICNGWKECLTRWILPLRVELENCDKLTVDCSRLTLPLVVASQVQSRKKQIIWYLIV